MDEGQTQFRSFILARVYAGSEAEADALLQESFSRHGQGTLDHVYLCGFIPNLLKLIRPEHAPEVEQVISNFKP